MFNKRDEFFMRRALELAAQAVAVGEIPVGAVVVLNDEIIGEGFNAPISRHDPTAHAEIIALRNAATKLGNYRLIDTSLYVTLEPCLMCAGAMVHARVGKLIYGTPEPKAGAIVSRVHTLEYAFLNHRVQCIGGLMMEECSNVLKEFFKARR